MYSKQHKRKKLLTSISTIALTTILAFTSIPLTNVYATEKTNPTSKSSNKTSNTGGIQNTAGNGGSLSGSGSTNQAESVGESLYGADIYYGYRFYIVNQDLVRVSDLYDFYFDDMPWSNIKENDEYYETRFDAGALPANKSNTKQGTMADLQVWCTLDGRTTNYTTPTKPVEGLSAQGASFRKWFLQDDGTGSAPPIYTPSVSTSTGSTTNKTYKNDLSTSNVNIEIINIEEITKFADPVSMSAVIELDNILYTYQEELENMDGAISHTIYANGMAIAEEKYNITRTKYNLNSAKGYSDVEAACLAINSVVKGDGRIYGATEAVVVYELTRYLSLYLYTMNSTAQVASTFNSDLMASNIPLSNGDHTANATPEQANCPAYCMLNKEDTIKLHTTDINGKAVYYGKYAAEALARYNCLLIVEPIVSLRMMKAKGIYDFAQSCLVKYYDSTYSYGSAWNLIEKWRGSQVCTFVPRLDVYIPNSLVIEKTYTTKSGKQILGVDGSKEFYTDSSRRFTELAEKMNTATESGGKVNGIALHVYDASDIFKSSSTSTYDEHLQNQIGPSEDCATLPNETDYGQNSKTVNILKVYTTLKADGSEVVDGAFLRTKVPHQIAIESEPDYNVIKWETSAEKTTLITEAQNGTKQYNYEQFIQNSTKNQSGTSENNITLSINEYTLYVKLLKQENIAPTPNRLTGDYILQESELAKAFQITPISIQYTFPKISFSESRGCGDHYNHRDTDGDGIDDDYDTCGGASSSSGYISDSKATVTIKNEAESSYSNIIVQSDKAKFKSDMTVVELDRGTNADSFNTSANHKYTFNVYRYQQGEQNLTLCKYWQKQSSNKDVSVGTTQTIAASNKDIAKTLGYSEASSKSTKSRAEIDYKIPVTFKFIFDTSSPDKSTSYYLHGDDCSCGDEHVGGYSRGKDIDTATTVESEADISVQVYSGTSNKQLHTKLWTETIGRNGEKYLPIRDNNNKTVGRQVQSTSTIKFNPFIKMTYSIVDDLKNNTVKKYPVNVLSEYHREILNTDYAEVAWQYQANSANLSLLSNMWSVDEVLTNNKDSWRQKNQVLKGGASAALQIKDSDMRALTLRTYQTVFPDSDINDYLTNATDYSVDKAVTEHDAFIQSAVDTFEQLHIVQRVSTRIEDSIDDMADENKVERGGNISFLNNNSNTASSDSKYYLSKDLSGLNAGADEGDLDVKLGSTSKKFFKVWSDTSGNILIAEGTDINALKNNISGTVILTKNQDSSSLTNQTAIDLNNRTFIVDKLINAVERNTGNDVSAEWASSDGKWYNESFALYILESTTGIKLGFRDVSTRALVIDPRLIPYLSSKSEQGKTAFTSQFTTDNFSETWGSSEEGKVAVFKGQSIYMQDMNKLFTSKIFYIPSFTVQGSR